MHFLLVFLCAFGAIITGVSSATIRPTIGSPKNNDPRYWPPAMISPARNDRHRSFRRLTDTMNEMPRLRSSNENSVKRVKIPITTYRNRDFTTPRSHTNNFRRIPEFSGPRTEHQHQDQDQDQNQAQAAPGSPGGQMTNKRIAESMVTKSRSLPQTSRFAPNPQNFGLPQTVTQFNDRRNFASRSLFRQPLGESDLVGLIPFGTPSIDPHSIHSFLPRPLEEDFEDYELFSYPFQLFRRPFLSHRPHPIVTERLASIGFTIPSPIRLYQSLQVSDGANALSAIGNPLVINAKGSSKRILDSGGLHVTRDDLGQTPFFREQPLRNSLENSQSVPINPNRPQSRFSVELIGGSTYRQNEKQLGRRFRAPSYVTGIPPHNHPLLERFDMRPFLDT